MIRTDTYTLIPDSIMTADQLRAKKACCKSACLNCPYEYTVKKHGLLFKKIHFDEIIELRRYFKRDLSVNYKDYELIILKEFLVGVMLADEMFVLELELHPLIDSRIISKELVESYYF